VQTFLISYPLIDLPEIGNGFTGEGLLMQITVGTSLRRAAKEVMGSASQNINVW
jgi:hypothetical protein